MDDEKETDKKAVDYLNSSPGDLVFTSKEDVEDLMLLFASEKETDKPLLDHFFSVNFKDVEDYDSFLDRLISSHEKVKPLLHEISDVEALLVYLKDTKWANHPMVGIFRSHRVPLNFLLLKENASDHPEFQIDTWSLLDFFLAESSEYPQEISPWDSEIKNALFHTAIRCDLDSESEKFMYYFERVVQKLRYRRDVRWSAYCFYLRLEEGKSRKEIMELDPWEFY